MGANVKIGANSTEFQKQMKDMVRQMKVLGSEFNLANTKAKLFGSGIDSLKVKQTELTKKIELQNKIVETQGKHLKNLTGVLDKQKIKQTELRSSIDKATEAYNKSKEATGKNSEETKKLHNTLKDLKQAYANNERAIDSSNAKIDNSKIALNKSKKALEENKKALEDVNKSIKNSKLDEFNKKLDNASEKASAMGSALALGITGPVIAAGGASFKMASDLNENLNKTETVFANNADAVKEWSKTSLEKMGLSQSAALDMASKYGDMGSSMDLSADKTKEYALGLSQLAADMASFKNISIERADEALTSVYTGETESLKSLGIVMTQTNLQAFARSKGINKNIQDMTQAEQVQLRYAYVMDKTKNAQGDFAKTSDEAANQMRIFQQSTKELGATFGQYLIPAITPIIQKINGCIKSFGNLSEGTQKTIMSMIGIAAVVGPTLIAFTKITSGVKSLVSSFKDVKDFSKEAITKLKDIGSTCSKGVKSVGNFAKSVGKIGWNGITKGASLAKQGITGLARATLNGAKAVGTFTLNLLKMGVQLAVSGAKMAFNTAKMIAHKVATVATSAATKLMSLAQAALNLVMSLNPITLIIGLLVGLGATFLILYNKCEWFRNGVKAVWNGITSVFKTFTNFLSGAFTTDWTQKLGLLGVPLNYFFGVVGSIWNGVKGIFSGIIDFVAGVFTGNWGRAWNGVKQVFSSIFSTLGGILKAPINAAISAVNVCIRGLNKLNFTVPDWIPGIGGKNFGFNIPQIPKLAEGGYVDKATLAVVGEGKSAEIVAPEPKLNKAVYENTLKALKQKQEQNIYIVVNSTTELDGEVIGNKVYKTVAKKTKSDTDSYRFIQGKRGFSFA